VLGEGATVALTVSAILFAVFALNVFMGATANANFLTDVQEMLLLLAASIAFVAAILRREALARKSDKDRNQ